MRTYLDKCPCGSDQPGEAMLDARGIFCDYVCSQCEDDKRAKYRPEIFTDSQYYSDEPIEPDDGEGFYD